MLHTVAQVDGGPGGRRISPGDIFDLFGGHTADGFSPVRSILTDMILQPFESMTPPLHKSTVNQASPITTCSMARARAASVPGRTGTQTSARPTSGSTEGLMAMMVAPRFLASHKSRAGRATGPE